MKKNRNILSILILLTGCNTYNGHIVSENEIINQRIKLVEKSCFDQDCYSIISVDGAEFLCNYKGGIISINSNKNEKVKK